MGQNPFPVNYRSCRLNNGRHVPSTGKSADWNSELITEIRAKFVLPCFGFEDELPDTPSRPMRFHKYNFRTLKFRLGGNQAWFDSDEVS